MTLACPRVPKPWRKPTAALGVSALAGLLLTLLAFWLFLNVPRPADPAPAGMSVAATATATAVPRPLADWFRFEGWSGRSINFNRDAPRDAALAPVPAVALWVCLSLLVYLALARPWREPAALPPAVILFLLGWFALDLRWQWDLGQRLLATHARYAGLDANARARAAPDGAFLPFIDAVRRYLPDRPARVIVLTADPHDYVAGRIRYHLLPHNALARRALPPGAPRTGDYLLLIKAPPNVVLDPTRRRLRLDGVELGVEWLYGDRRHGLLLRVREAP